MFSGGWTLDAADTVCRDRSGQKHRRRSRSTRVRLVDKSLVETIQIDDAATRYDMLETIRAYAAETLAGGRRGGHRHDPRRAPPPLRRAHRTGRPKLTQPDQIAWFDRLDADAANLHAAVAYGVRHDPEARSASPSGSIATGAAGAPRQ